MEFIVLKEEVKTGTGNEQRVILTYSGSSFITIIEKFITPYETVKTEYIDVFADAIDAVADFCTDGTGYKQRWCGTGKCNYRYR